MRTRILSFTCLLVLAIAGVACAPVTDDSSAAAPAATGYMPPTVSPESRDLTRADIERMMEELSNWGRWGADDQLGAANLITPADRKSTRLNSRHVLNSYAVFCLKKKQHNNKPRLPYAPC